MYTYKIMTMARENTMNDNDDNLSACNGWFRKALKASSLIYKRTHLQIKKSIN